MINKAAKTLLSGFKEKIGQWVEFGIFSQIKTLRGNTFHNVSINGNHIGTDTCGLEISCFNVVINL